MRLWQVLSIVVLLIALPVMSACACGSKISADEAIAIVKQDATWAGDEGWNASYEGKGHWCVTMETRPHLNESGNLVIYYRHTWDYYEGSGIVDYVGREKLSYPYKGQ